MQKIIKVSVPEYRKLHVEFEDGIEGSLRIDDDFIGVAQKLNDPRCFANVKIIDDGYAIGFDDCEYDICSSWIYAEIAPSLSNVSAM
jgi:Protein of unknown function (DUF2442).